MSDVEAQTVSFTRDTMLPAAAPPRMQAGALAWVRQNLLSGPLNIILTLAAVWLAWSVLSGFLPWAWRGVWDAGSLAECREVRDARYGEGAEAACWAVIPNRWHQFVYGIYYPVAGYWRPPMALLVFLAGVAPVLFAGLPRRTLWLTAAMPFLCFWLLVGGPVWGPVLAAVGLGLGVAALGPASRRLGSLAGLAALVVVPVLFWALVAGPLGRALSGAAPLSLIAVDPDRLGGFTLSIAIGISAICLSLPLGVVMALARRSDMPIVSTIAVAYIEVIRGVPLIVWLFTAQLLLNYFLPREAAWKPDLVARVVIMVTLFASAYIAEVVRGGLAALPKGQLEAAEAMGLDYWQAMRLIVLPQALKISIPGIVGTFIGLFKDTTLVITIGLLDPMGIAKQVRSDTDWNGVYWEIYIFVGLIFFVFCYAMSRYSIWLERRLERDHRR